MRTILILDDESAVRDSFVDYFEDHDWEVVQAESAEQAVALLEKRSVDAAVVDVRLPGKNGNDFIRTVLPRVQNTVFVICSGSPEYFIPADLEGIPCMSKTLFKKPVNRIGDLEQEILRIMDRMAAGRRER